MEVRMHMRLCILLVSALVLTSGLECTKADVIFGNFGPNNSFDIFNLGFGRVPTETMRAYQAAAFTPMGRNFRLDDFTVAVQFTPIEQPSPEPFDIFLLSSSAGGSPDGVIESFSETVVAPVSPTLFTIASAFHPTLVEGDQYWIAMTAGSVISPSIAGGWNLNVIGDTGPLGLGTNLTSLTTGFGTRPAFEVDGTPVAVVPEPSSVSLIVAGMLGLCFIRLCVPAYRGRRVGRGQAAGRGTVLRPFS
jgi:hypothetical protein